MKEEDLLDYHPKEEFDLLESREFIDESMSQLLKGSRITIQDHVVNTPDGSGQYLGCWPRDFTMICESGHPEIDANFIREGLELFLNNVGDSGGIPDWIPHGRLARVVHRLFSKHPFLDNAHWLIRLMVLYLEKTRAETGILDLDFFSQNESKLMGGLNARGMLDENHELLYLKDDINKNLVIDWGFTDCIKKTGHVLFGNLLKLDTYRSLSEIHRYLGNKENQMMFQSRYLNLQDELIEKLLDDSTHLFFSATGINKKIDVWGNAFAVYLGVLPSGIEEIVTKSLLRNKEKYCWKGHVRHLFKPETWEAFMPWPASLLRFRPNTYQNGAYWGTPSGWVAYTLEKAKKGEGKKLLEDLLLYFRKIGIYECIHPRFIREYRKCKNYVASLALPMRMVLR